MNDSVKNVILSRRTSKTSLPQPVSKELLFELLEQASFAPFHKKEPWAVKIAATTEEKEFLFQKILASYKRNGQIHDESSERRMTFKTNRLIREAPATLLFAREKFAEEPRLDSDSIQATAALIQNFSLLAFDRDLVGFWASSPFLFDEEIAGELGFAENFEIMANYRIGYRDLTLPSRQAKRRHVTEWVASLLEKE